MTDAEKKRKVKLTNKQKQTIRYQLLHYSENILLAKDDKYSGCPDEIRGLDDSVIMEYCAKLLHITY